MCNTNTYAMANFFLWTPCNTLADMYVSCLRRRAMAISLSIHYFCVFFFLFVHFCFMWCIWLARFSCLPLCSSVLCISRAYIFTSVEHNFAWCSYIFTFTRKALFFLFFSQFHIQLEQFEDQFYRACNKTF